MKPGMLFFILVAFSENRIHERNARLRETDYADVLPTISLDGTKVAFLSTRNSKTTRLYIADIDGKNIYKLAPDTAINYRATWSPDGKQIAFGRKEDKVYQIAIINIDGSGQRELTSANADSQVN